jgi:hypothetical protein
MLRRKVVLVDLIRHVVMKALSFLFMVVGTRGLQGGSFSRRDMNSYDPLC